MSLFRDPLITLEDIRLRKFSFSSIDMDVKVRVDNPNSFGITLREIPFTVLCASGDTTEQLADGNTGKVKIAGNRSTLLDIPVTSQNAALISAVAALVTKGGVRVIFRGEAVINAILFSWPVPFEKTMPVMMDTVAESLAGDKKA